MKLIVKEFPNKREAMRFAEATGKSYTVRPVGNADVTKPWIVEYRA